MARSPSFIFLIPALTTTAITEVKKLGKGQCKQITVLVPAGHSRLTTLKILRHGRQLFPENNDVNYIGDGTTYTIITDFITTGGDDQIIFEGTNTDDTFEHRFIVQFEMHDLPPEELQVRNPNPSFGQIDFKKPWDVVRDVFGKRSR